MINFCFRVSVKYWKWHLAQSHHLHHVRHELFITHDVGHSRPLERGVEMVQHDLVVFNFVFVDVVLTTVLIGLIPGATLFPQQSADGKVMLLFRFRQVARSFQERNVSRHHHESVLATK